MLAWPLKSCTMNADCPVGTYCNDQADDVIKDIPDPFDLLIYGEWDDSPRDRCQSTQGDSNKFVADLMEYFTGKTEEENQFNYCFPKWEEPDFDGIPVGHLHLLALPAHPHANDA